MMDWAHKYNAASDELERAREQYKRAECLLAVATSGLNRARAKVSELFKERMAEAEQDDRRPT